MYKRQIYTGRNKHVEVSIKSDKFEFLKILEQKREKPKFIWCKDDHHKIIDAKVYMLYMEDIEMVPILLFLQTNFIYFICLNKSDIMEL